MKIFFVKLHSIIWGYAIISHKAQRATILNKVIVKIKNVFAPNFTYDMLSQIKIHKHLVICYNLTLNGWKHEKMNQTVCGKSLKFVFWKFEQSPWEHYM